IRESLTAVQLGSAVPDPADVVREADDEEEEHNGDADRRDALVGLARDRATADALDDREGDVPPVERQEREQVEQCEREADQRQHLEVVAEPGLERLARRLRDADDARHLVPARAGDDTPERGADRLRHLPGGTTGELERLEEPVGAVERRLRAEADDVAVVLDPGSALLELRTDRAELDLATVSLDSQRDRSPFRRLDLIRDRPEC